MYKRAIWRWGGGIVLLIVVDILLGEQLYRLFLSLPGAETIVEFLGMLWSVVAPKDLAVVLINLISVYGWLLYFEKPLGRALGIIKVLEYDLECGYYCPNCEGHESVVIPIRVDLPWKLTISNNPKDDAAIGLPRCGPQLSAELCHSAGGRVSIKGLKGVLIVVEEEPNIEGSAAPSAVVDLTPGTWYYLVPPDAPYFRGVSVRRVPEEPFSFDAVEIPTT